MRAPPTGGPRLYEEIEHTADVGIVVRADRAGALFEKAALALYAIMVETANVEPRGVRVVTARGENWTELLHAWLSEILVLFSTEAFVAGEVVVEELQADRIRGSLRGERFDPKRHEFRGEVKAVTFHDLAVRADQDGWCAQVILDV
jgi:SHS2 domain-containing protein